MPNVKHRMLTHEKVNSLAKPGTYSDGGGLTLRVSNSGRKHWVHRVTIDGTPRNAGLGSYPAVGLSEARERAQENRTAIRQGRDPIKEKRSEMEQIKMQASFREVSEALIESLRPTWRTPDSAKQWESSLSSHVFPVIGDKRVSEINTNDVTKVLMPIWMEKEETARRVLQRMAKVFDYAIVKGWRQDNPAGKHVLHSLPEQLHRKEHHPTLPFPEVPNAVATVRDSSADPITKLAFEFMVLTASRPGEVRSADWSEFDLANRVWTIPASRMKTQRTHRVPLSDRAVAILTEVRPHTNGEGLVFPSMRSISNGEPKPLSNTAFAVLQKRLEIAGVPHGFRTSFVNWTIESQGPSSIRPAEIALGHTEASEIREAFGWSDLLEVRRGLMQSWAHFVGTGESLPFE